MTVTADRSVEEFTATPRQLFIDGSWVPAASGKTFETPDPSTGETLAQVAEGDAEDIDRAVRAARRAFDEGPWGRITVSERGRIIWRIGDLILEHAEELAQLESLDNGKPYAVALAADVRGRPWQPGGETANVCGDPAVTTAGGLAVEACQTARSLPH
jgi:phenylacetaldehyde dehydrogenase